MVKKIKWTESEVNLLKEAFDKIPNIPQKYSKSKLIVECLKEKGFIRTSVAINRKLYNLGLTNFTQNSNLIKTKCSNCQKEIKILKRYMNRNNYCPICREEKKKEWNKKHSLLESRKKYLKKYSGVKN